MTDGVRRTLEEVGDRFQVTRERIRQISSSSSPRPGCAIVFAQVCWIASAALLS